MPAVGLAARCVLTTFLYIGATRIALDAARGRKVRLATLFSGGDVLLSSLAVAVLASIVVVVGLCCAIVPGIYLALGLSLVNILIADRGLGPIEACRESLRLARGHRWSLFKIGVLGVVILFLGVLALLVGVFPASALAQLLMVHAYLQLCAETSVTSQRAS
ncbi:MAG: hypothetical protein ACXVEF_13590 [Polyangiales bacterium]